MIPAERRARLIKLLNDDGYVQVAEIAEEFGISPMTIRRDLFEMEKEGVCIRKRGGAVRNSQSVTMELPYNIKQNRNVDVKKRIAEAALNLIVDGNSLILDSGTTTFALAQRLAARRRLFVVTNDLQIATKLAANPEISVVCTGGMARPNVFSLQGALAESCFSNLSVDITFLGADAIHPDGGIYNVNIEEVPIKQAMLRTGAKIILLTDSTKFTLRGIARVCDFSQIDIVITDDQIAPEAKEMIRSSIRENLILV
jgi:DeoR/GlpR family transcriptional regulator of sugar metabolism